MIIECSTCSKTKKIRPAKAKDRNFCSHDCYWEDLKRTVIVKCDNCKKDLTRKPSSYHDENFCNIKCRSEFRRGVNHPRYVEYKKKYCSECNNEIPRYLLVRENSKFCSFECKLKGMSGSKNVGFKGGNWPYKKFSTYFKATVRNFYNDTCAICNLKWSESDYKRKFHLHHVDNDKTNSDLKNLILLCPKCHKSQHKKL